MSRNRVRGLLIFAILCLFTTGTILRAKADDPKVVLEEPKPLAPVVPRGPQDPSEGGIAYKPGTKRPLNVVAAWETPYRADIEIVAVPVQGGTLYVTTNGLHGVSAVFVGAR